MHGMRKLINSLSSGFSCCHFDPNLYVKDIYGDILILVPYEDDLIFIGSSPDMIIDMKKKLTSS
jgi:hypothetical protein